MTVKSGTKVVLPQPHGGVLTPFQKGKPGGPGRPKGSKHVSTWIQELLNDEEFDLSKFVAGKPYKGAPMQAIIITAVVQALQGDPKWADLLFKYGYGTNTKVEHSGAIAVQPILSGLSKDVHADDSNDQAS